MQERAGIGPGLSGRRAVHMCMEHDYYTPRLVSSFVVALESVQSALDTLDEDTARD
jgi:hypothetical protein